MMAGKIFEIIKDKLFDVCYKIVWMKKWMLAGIVCIGLFFFYMSYLNYDAVLRWTNIPPRTELQQISGCLSEYRRKVGGPVGGPSRMEIILEDGSRYYVMNSVLSSVVWPRVFREVEPGDAMELIVHQLGSGQYEPRVLEISKNGTCYVSYEESIIFYKEEAENFKIEAKWSAVAGVIFCMYGITFLVIQCLLS